VNTTIMLLAAGGSTRMRGADKLLQKVDGLPLLTRNARIALSSDATETIVILGANRAAREAALDDLPIRFVVNEDWHAGMGTSIAVGTAALADDADAVIVMLADMPDIGVDFLNRFIASARPGAILQPVTKDGKRGNPVLFSRIHFPSLAMSSGDEGARRVIDANRDSVIPVPAESGVLTDLDTPEAWSAWRSRNGH
jgi:molybdenum cofactor cytidylyltransferase